MNKFSWKRIFCETSLRIGYYMNYTEKLEVNKIFSNVLSNTIKNFIANGVRTRGSLRIGLLWQIVGQHTGLAIKMILLLKVDIKWTEIQIKENLLTGRVLHELFRLKDSVDLANNERN